MQKIAENSEEHLNTLPLSHPLRSSRGRPKKNVDETMNPDDKGVCERVAFILTDQGLSQQEAAEAIGTQQAAVSRIINYKNAPSIMMLKKIIKAFNVNSDYLLFGDKSKGYYNNKAEGNTKIEQISKQTVNYELEKLKANLENVIHALAESSE